MKVYFCGKNPDIYHKNIFKRRLNIINPKEQSGCVLLFPICDKLVLMSCPQHWLDFPDHLRATHSIYKWYPCFPTESLSITRCWSKSTTWWRHQIDTFSALLALCAGNSPVTVEFPAQRPVTRSFEVSFDLRLNKRLSNQSWGWWFETPSRSFWRNRNGRPYLERGV